MGMKTATKYICCQSFQPGKGLIVTSTAETLVIFNLPSQSTWACVPEILIFK